MCLAIPGKVLDTEEIGGLRVGRVQFGGITRKAYLDFVPDVVPGDYVIVHVGFAISKLNEEEAQATYALLEKTGLLAEEGLAEESPATDSSHSVPSRDREAAVSQATITERGGSLPPTSGGGA